MSDEVWGTPHKRQSLRKVLGQIGTGVAIALMAFTFLYNVPHSTVATVCGVEVVADDKVLVSTDQGMFVVDPTINDIQQGKTYRAFYRGWDWHIGFLGHTMHREAEDLKLANQQNPTACN